MKKFSFNLESLLVMREWEERRTRLALAEASAQITQLERQLEFLEGEKAKAFADWTEAGEDRFSPRDRMSFDAHLERIESNVTNSSNQLGLAREQRERAMEALSMATRRKRAVENLKEKRKEEHAAEAMKQEAAEIEDIFNARKAITHI